jgi:hypothetical protein
LKAKTGLFEERSHKIILLSSEHETRYLSSRVRLICRIFEAMPKKSLNKQMVRHLFHPTNGFFNGLEINSIDTK